MIVVNTLVADKQKLFWQGMLNVLENQKRYKFNIIEIADHTSQVIDALHNHTVDLLIVDFNIDGNDPLGLIETIRQKDRDVRILVLSNYTNHKVVKDAMKNGADGYVLKSHDEEILFNAFDMIFSDKTYIGPGISLSPSNNIKINSKAPHKFEDRFLVKRHLTKREQEVLKLVAQAKSNKEIASELYISDQTVGVHKKNIMKKFGLRNSANLIKFAYDYQLV